MAKCGKCGGANPDNTVANEDPSYGVPALAGKAQLHTESAQGFEPLPEAKLIRLKPGLHTPNRDHPELFRFGSYRDANGRVHLVTTTKKPTKGLADSSRGLRNLRRHPRIARRSGTHPGGVPEATAASPHPEKVAVSRCNCWYQPPGRSICFSPAFVLY